MGKYSSYYFDHDYSARNDSRILQLREDLGWIGYALYFATLECLCEMGGFMKRHELPGISFGLFCPKNEFEAFIDTCLNIGLFNEDERGIYSNRILEHLEFRNKLSEWGRLGGRPKASPKPGRSLPQAINDSKVNEINKGDASAAVSVIMNIEQLREIFFGETFIEDCCMKLGADKRAFLSFVKRWVTKKELDGNFRFTKPKLRQYLLSDWEREINTRGVNGQDSAKKMTKKIGEM